MKSATGAAARRWILPLALLVLLVTLFFRQQAIADWVRLRGYAPSPAIAAIAADTTMTDDGRHLFYINRPTLDDKDAFRERCPNRREHSIVLGCYHPVQRGISVLQVGDPRLDGVEEVTSAHEMLHAVHDRLGRAERQRIDKLINEFAADGLRDERIKNTLESYEPEERTNEMHSIFGSEVRQLPSELERHYARYFSDRQRVVTAAERYTAAFESRKAEVARYDAQLTQWQTEIDALSQELETRERRLNQSRAELDGYESSGAVAKYNTAVPDYNAQVQTYNSRIAQVRELIARYNRTVEARNAVALEEQDLQQQLDSSYQPAG